MVRNQYSDLNTEGKCRAIVVKRDDPTMQGCIGVIIPKLMPYSDPAKGKVIERDMQMDKEGISNPEIKGMIKNAVKTSNFMWARPLKEATGRYRIPYLHSTVYVEMEDGDPQKLYYYPYGPSQEGESTSMDTAGMTKDSYVPGNKPNIHILETFKDGTILYYNENGGTREYGIKFASGFEFVMGDNAEKQGFLLTTTKGDKITIDQLNQNILIATSLGHQFVLDDKNQNISVKSTGGKSILMDDKADNVTIVDNGGNTILMDSGAGNINIKNGGGAKVDMNGPNVSIN